MCSKSSRMMGAKLSPATVLLGALCLTLGALLLIHRVEAMQMIDGGQSDSIRSSGSPAASLAFVENPELTARVLENLLRSILYSTLANDLQPTGSAAQKRGLDLGISRGFSGSQAGKHLMGLSAASFANGPGR